MNYATFESRAASFVPPTKRAKGWPHKSPSPADLAKAGFFYKPTSSKDNVECFMCSRYLDGWEQDDDPIQEHLKHGPDCAWALLVALELDRSYDTSSMEDPTGPHITEARRSTFEIMGWPHESKRGWTCKTEKMVEAGWHFAPTSECEDYTSCVYCKLSLDGWEPKDNPFEEHYRRSPDCPFFVFAGTTAASKRPKKTGGKASRTSRTSKASSRLSTQSNTTMMSQADESTGIIEILGHDSTLEDSKIMDNSIVSIQSTASTATNKAKRKPSARAKTVEAKKAKTTRGKKKEPEPASQLEQEMEIDLELELQSEAVAEQPPPKKTVVRKRQPELELEVAEQTEEQLKPKKSRSKKKKELTPEHEPEIEPQLEEAEEEIDLESKPEPEVTEEKVKRKTSRGNRNEQKSKTSPRAQQEQESGAEPEATGAVQDDTLPQEDLPGTYPMLPEETPDGTFTDALEEPQNEGTWAAEEESEQGATPQPQAQSTGPPEKESTPIPVKQISPLKEQSNPPRRSITQVDAERSESPLYLSASTATTLANWDQKENQSKRKSSRRSSARQTKPGSNKSHPRSSAKQQPPQKDDSDSTAGPSDQENRPPSTLSKQNRPPLSSPGAPPPQWKPIDVDTVFATNEDIDPFGVAVNRTLDEEEKDMTVQEWIEHIAGQAAQKLSAEGERIVGVFEREGRRALTTLEAIECS